MAQNARKLADVEDTVNMWVFEEMVPVTAVELQEAFRRQTGNNVQARLGAADLQRLVAEELLLGTEFGLDAAEAAVKQFAAPGAKGLGLEQLQNWWSNSSLAGQPRKLTELINSRGENVKYLSGIHLGDNVRAVPDLRSAVQDATMLVFVTPHQFVRGVCDQLKGHIDPSQTSAISLIKVCSATEPC